MVTKKWEEVFEGLPEKERREALALAEAWMSELPLGELRRARAMTQEALAAELGVKQATVSKIERRADMYVSTLSRFVAALGGELEIIARFPDGAMRISQFRDIGTQEPERSPRGDHAAGQHR